MLRFSDEFFTVQVRNTSMNNPDFSYIFSCVVFVTAAVVRLILAVAAVTATAAVLTLAAFFVVAAFSVVFPSAAVAVVVPVAAAPFALEIDRVAALEAEDTLQHHMVLDMACVH